MTTTSDTPRVHLTRRIDGVQVDVYGPAPGYERHGWTLRMSVDGAPEIQRDGWDDSEQAFEVARQVIATERKVAARRRERAARRSFEALIRETLHHGECCPCAGCATVRRA